jgi:hypothetical protein
MELGGCVRSTAGDNLGFSFRSRMLYADVETASPDRIPQAAFLVAGDYGEGNALGINGAEFWDRELVRRQGFEQEGSHQPLAAVPAVQPPGRNAPWGSMASSATLQTPYSPHIQYLPSYLLVYFYSAPLVWFYSALDTGRERFVNSTGPRSEPRNHPLRGSCAHATRDS